MEDDERIICILIGMIYNHFEKTSEPFFLNKYLSESGIECFKKMWEGSSDLKKVLVFTSLVGGGAKVERTKYFDKFYKEMF